MGRSEPPKALEMTSRMVGADCVTKMVWRREASSKTTSVPFWRTGQCYGVPTAAQLRVAQLMAATRTDETHKGRGRQVCGLDQLRHGAPDVDPVALLVLAALQAVCSPCLRGNEGAEHGGLEEGANSHRDTHYLLTTLLTRSTTTVRRPGGGRWERGCLSRVLRRSHKENAKRNTKSLVPGRTAHLYMMQEPTWRTEPIFPPGRRRRGRQCGKANLAGGFADMQHQAN